MITRQQVLALDKEPESQKVRMDSYCDVSGMKYLKDKCEHDVSLEIGERRLGDSRSWVIPWNYESIGESSGSTIRQSND